MTVDIARVLVVSLGGFGGADDTLAVSGFEGSGGSGSEGGGGGFRATILRTLSSDLERPMRGERRHRR